MSIEINWKKCATKTAKYLLIGAGVAAATAGAMYLVNKTELPEKAEKALDEYKKEEQN